MLSFMYSYFTDNNTRKQNKPKYTYRDELDKKLQSPSNLIKKSAELEDGGEKLEGESQGRGEGREGTRVKILMTKEEASRLLSKFEDEGVLEFKDMARELGKIPTSRVSVVSSSSTCSDRVLERISKEL